ncbi:pyridoxal-phosphate dependent enzyme [Colletotrichum orchidophilum]|uniref:L-serine ammonia-lyase n=1 Tax=Colletotrichum orchidophilum TaxID=1209926 RepID=A0A1G4BMV3_9PEZI|nr:pyridoxal-phosphate dependent enzyme [Colletotrichum orchidophilum]OHF02771.1 pyridoxal-phosphate dependent enzyme [Colletotrichum orchidophilum]
MGSLSPDFKKPWIQTPCIASATLSRAAGCNIFLKLENLQPSGSFKSRGVGNLMVRAAADAAPGQDSHFYCSSGGNAGLACATSAIALNRKATIVVPMTTSPLMISKLRLLGADVRQIGANWAEADRHLREEMLGKDTAGVYVPPFDHPHVWDGASTIADELVSQMGAADVEVSAIVCSVGGGGLLAGLAQGVSQNRWPGDGREPRLVAVETVGADSLNASVLAGELVTLPGIKSIAGSLGAVRVAARAWEVARDTPGFQSVTVTDAEAALACVRFVDDAQLVVEVACGATIATAYNGALRKHLGAGLSDEEWAKQNIVLIVCGGSNVTMEMLNEYSATFGNA